MPTGEFDGDDAALALSLQQQERARYRRRDASTKVERFEPGGNPNVLDYGAVATPESIVETDEMIASYTTSKGIAKPPASEAATASVSRDRMEQEAEDAALAAKLAAAFNANPLLSSATEKVKFGGRKRKAVESFQPGGDPRKTDPAAEYNLPPSIPKEENDKSAKRPKILTRKPGRVSREEEARLLAAEEATQARLQDLLQGFDGVQGRIVSDSSDDSDTEEEDDEIKQIEVQMSMVDLLSKQRSIFINNQHATVSVKCYPPVLELTEEEAEEVERQSSELYGDDSPSVGCMISLEFGEKVHYPDVGTQSRRGEGEHKDEDEERAELNLTAPEHFAGIVSTILDSYLYSSADHAMSIASKKASEHSIFDLTKSFMEHHSAYPIGALVDIAGVIRKLEIQSRQGFDILDVLCECWTLLLVCCMANLRVILF